MKRTAFIGFVLVLLLGVNPCEAQRKRNLKAYSEQVPKTLVGQFEFEMDMNKFKKDSLQQKFRTHITQLKHTIDTLDISDKRRRRLLAILKVNPFDDRLLELAATANSDKKEEHTLK